MLGLSFIHTCVVCGRPWLKDDERWRAYHIGELDEPVELVIYCPGCASSEIDGD